MIKLFRLNLLSFPSPHRALMHLYNVHPLMSIIYCFLYTVKSINESVHSFLISEITEKSGH